MPIAPAPTLHHDPATGVVTLDTGALELIIATQPVYNPHRLCDVTTGRAYADRDYVWPAGAPVHLAGAPRLTRAADGTCTATFALNQASLAMEHTFTLPGDEPGVLLETLTLSNPTDQPLATAAFACGFGKLVRVGADWQPDLADLRLAELPYRHHPETGELRDFSVPELLAAPGWFSTMRSPIYQRQTSPAYGAEGWAWYAGAHVLHVSKYNPDALEWSVLEPVPQDGATVLRWGGAARWKLGDPEGAARLAPGARFTFGQTRYRLMPGGWRAAWADFRQMMDGRGHRLPPNYNPPVHWNELYDNPYFWTVVADPWHLDRPERRAELYDRPHLQIEIDKALALGCECFYLDPGWDTDFGSTLWDAARLGPQAEFAAQLRAQHGLALALHTPLAPWTNHASYPLEARQRGPDGQRRDDLCVLSEQYQAVKAERLRTLCRDGAYFLMFDGSWYEHPCYAPDHGHRVPSTRQEHVAAIQRLAQAVHAAYPQVTIEQHDPITGPGTPRYTPTYFLHAQPGAFDELWGFEYMLNALDDLTTGRALALYDFNLAYNLPIYLHFDLRTDNAQAVGFWWFASTCRHLGFGGQHPDPAVWAAHRQAMQTYLQYKPFFTQGVFGGPDELTHVHTLPDRAAAVVNCFNLSAAPATRTVELSLAELGLANGRPAIAGADDWQLTGDTLTLTLSLPALGQRLVTLNV